MTNFIREIATGPGRGLNKAFDAVGIGRSNSLRKFSASSQLATSVHDDDQGLSIRRLLNPSGTGNILDPAGGTTDLLARGDASQTAASQLPGTPTIDQAQQSLQDSDRLRRRRGVLANIFGGGRGSQPTVAVKTLLGQ